MNKKFKYAGLAVVVLGLIAMVGNSIDKNSGSAEASYEPKGKPVANTLQVQAAQLPARSTSHLPVRNIELSESNSVVFREEFTAASVAKAQRELLQKNRKLDKGEPLYIVMDSPGGSIDAGNQLIDTAKSLGRPVHTITVFAASMGFNTVQQLGNRYILPSGYLMAHRAYAAGLGGQIPGELLTTVGTILRTVTRLEEKNAKRLGISMDEYTRLVNAEYWVEGEDAVRQNAADELASISCDASLDGTVTQTVETFFGPVNIVWDKCPAVTQPLGFQFNGNEADHQALKRQFRDYNTFRRQVAR